MRPDAETDGAHVLNESDEHELIRIFREYADEPRSGRLAREIVRRRATRPFETSDDLVGAIRAVLGPRSGPPQFAPLFQAVRIAVNDELGVLERTLPRLRDRLTPDGVIAIISYHSGEDRLVKHAFIEWSASCICPPKQPACTCRGEALGKTVTRKPIRPTAEESEQNPRARSALLRAWRRAA
jgi:16S rRNA (cytosine1402-N4)-methyltransferase